MSLISKKYEYSYANAEPVHHHAYLTKPLLEMISEFATLNQNNQPLRILDVGCGNGSLSNILAQNGYEVVGLEESHSGVNFAIESFPKCHFIQGSIYNIPYTELGEKFDVIVACEVIEHLFSPKELVRNIKKCLKPNGILIITTPYNGYLKNLVIAALGKVDQHLTTLWDGGHIKFFSIATMTALLESEKCRNIRFKFAGRFPFLWKSMLCSSHPFPLK